MKKVLSSFLIMSFIAQMVTPVFAENNNNISFISISEGSNDDIT